MTEKDFAQTYVILWNSDLEFTDKVALEDTLLRMAERGESLPWFLS